MVSNGPDLLCIGCQKSGTGWLYDQLSGHPGTWMPPIKELDYFSHVGSPKGSSVLGRKVQATAEGGKVLAEGPWRRLLTEKDRDFLKLAAELDFSRLDFAAYRTLFRFKEGKLSGDISPNYSDLPDRTIAAIGKEFPDTRIVLLVRHPVERFWSQLAMRVRQRRLAAGTVHDWGELSAFLNSRPVQSYSFPAGIYRKWARHFPAGRILIGYFDEIAQQPELARDKIFASLGLEIIGDRHPLPAGYNRKGGKRGVDMPGEIRQRLVDYFSREIEDCAEVFGGPCREWLVRDAGPRQPAALQI